MPRLVSEQDTLALVRPWLGADALVGDLPLPRLIDAARHARRGTWILNLSGNG